LKTQAALFHSVDRPFEVAEIDIAEPGPGEVLIQVTACGICGTDLHIVKGEWTRPMPMVLGHECAGIVAAVGSEVDGIRAGDRVVVSWASSCGSCVACRKGRLAACRELRAAIGAGTLIDGETRLSRNGDPVYRMTTVGGFAEHVLMPAASVLRLPDDVELDQAAIVGCAALTGVGAVVNAAPLHAGGTALVVGAGGIGQFVVQGARIVGAAEIVVVDPVEERRTLAKQLGATEAVSPAELEELVADRFPDGFDCTIDAVGGAETTAMALRNTTIAGTAVLVGLPAAGGRLELDLADIVVNEKHIVGSIYGSADPGSMLPTLLEWVRSGQLELASLIGARYPLADVNDAVQASLAGLPGRVVLTMP
jgi:S-(hydroxymethyl)glutathione dehydrogenase / alcohol dehydrogenase